MYTHFLGSVVCLKSSVDAFAPIAFPAHTSPRLANFMDHSRKTLVHEVYPPGNRRSPPLVSEKRRSSPQLRAPAPDSHSTFLNKSSLPSASQTQWLQNRLVSLRIRPLEVVQEFPPLGHKLEQTTPGGKILPMNNQMLRKMIDSGRKACNLHVRTARVRLVKLERLKIDRRLTHWLCFFHSPTEKRLCLATPGKPPTQSRFLAPAT